MYTFINHLNRKPFEQGGERLEYHVERLGVARDAFEPVDKASAEVSGKKVRDRGGNLMGSARDFKNC